MHRVSERHDVWGVRKEIWDQQLCAWNSVISSSAMWRICVDDGVNARSRFRWWWLEHSGVEVIRNDAAVLARSTRCRCTEGSPN